MKKFFLFLLTFLLLVPQFALAQAETGVPPVQVDEFYRGKVVNIIKESKDNEFFVQDLKVELRQGPEKGKQIDIHYELRGGEEEKLRTGMLIVVGKNFRDAELPYYVSDIYRLRALWGILIFFFLVTIFFARMQGFRAFLGLIISFLIIAFGILPLLLKGHNPLLVCLIGSLAIASTTLYIAHGFHVRTTVAFVSILFTLGLAALFAYIFVVSAKLFGVGTEEAFFLQNSGIENMNLRGLLLGGILIGTLGVLDDIATAQAATVEEIHKANKTLGFSELYKRGLSVGREHIVALVNTLVLAYTGASFPLLLLFSIYQKPFWTTLNSEIIAEEVIRMLVGSVALIFAVPIVTVLAAFVFGHSKENKE